MGFVTLSNTRRRAIFFSLIGCFAIYSLMVYTSGTSLDTGAHLRSTQVTKGKKLYQELNCVACHQLYGLGGYMGPDITNVYSVKGEMYARAFLMNGTNRMPNYHLSDEDIESLIAYLRYVDQTGKSPVKHFKTNLDGTITPE